jgi:hypothetical protein
MNNESNLVLPPIREQTIKYFRAFFVTQFLLFFVGILAGFISSKFNNPITIISLIFSFLLFIALSVYLYFQYQDNPLVHEMFQLKSRQKEIQEGIAQSENSISECLQIRKRITEEESSQLDQRNRAHNSLIQTVNQKRSQYEEQETQKLSQELSALQNQHLVQGLKDALKLVFQLFPGLAKPQKKNFQIRGFVCIRYFQRSH